MKKRFLLNEISIEELKKREEFSLQPGDSCTDIESCMGLPGPTIPF